MTDTAYLPGCYRSVSLMPGEGLASYLLRVAEGNGYPGIAALLKANGYRSKRQLADALLHLRVDPLALGNLGRMTYGSADHLNGLLADALPPLTDPVEAIFLDECRIDRDAVVLAYGSLCPECLATDGYCNAAWELAAVTVCTRHGCLLRDHCAECGAAVTWARRSVRYCNECGAQLDDQRTQAVTDPRIVAVVEDFQALAPFRVTSGAEKPGTVQWDEMFRIFKAVLLPDSVWALGQWPLLSARNASIEERHQAITSISHCVSDGAYDLTRLRWKSDRALGPLTALPIPHSKETFARMFLEAEAGLSRESADAIAGSDVVPEMRRAYETTQPWPPALGSRDEVSRFLSVPAGDVDALIRTGRLSTPPARDHGFDADAVVAAGRYLSDLVDLSGLEHLAGLPAPPSALTPYGLLPRWNGTDLSDNRVDPDRLVDIQKQLMAHWHRSHAPVDPIRLGDAIGAFGRPFEALLMFVARACSGQFDRIGWDAPFRWTDLQIEGCHCASAGSQPTNRRNGTRRQTRDCQRDSPLVLK